MKKSQIRFTSFLGLVFTLSGVICAMSFQTAISPVIKTVGDSLNLSYVMKTVLMSAPSLGAVLLMIPAGRFLDRSNPVRFALPFLILVSLCSFCSLFAKDFTTLLILRLVVGIGFAPLLIYGIQLISLVAKPSEKNRLSTIQTLGAPMAYLLTSSLSPMITRALGYQFTYLIPLTFSLIGIILLIRFWNLEIPERPRLAQSKGWITRESVVLAVCWGLFSISTSVFIYLGANMAQDHGFSDIVAGLGNLAFAIPAMIVGFMIGDIVDKKVSRLTLMTIPSILLGIFIFITSLGKVGWIVGVFVMGFAAATIPPVIFTTPVKFEAPGKIAQAIGFINLVGMFSMLVAPPMAGLLKSSTGSWLVPFAFAGLTGASISLVVLFIKRGLA